MSRAKLHADYLSRKLHEIFSAQKDIEPLYKDTPSTRIGNPGMSTGL